MIIFIAAMSIIILQMKGPQYHAEFNPIVEDIDENIKEEEIDAEFMELQFKHAYLKNCYSKGQYQMHQSTSQLKPVVLNLLQNHRKFKVNALCEKPYFKNANSNLKGLTKKINCKVEENYILFVNWVEERFCFDCSIGKWMRVDKVQLLKRQYDVISQKKLYRINFTRRAQDRDVEELVRNLIKTQEWYNQGFLRFKHSFVYHIDPHFSIECNTIYESESGKDYQLIEKTFKENGNFANLIRDKVESEEKKQSTKDELELKITPEGIKYLRTCSLIQMRKLISRAFDQLRDITNQGSEVDIIKMMESLSIQTKKQLEKQEKGIQKDEKYPKVAQYLPEVRGELRYAFRKRQQ